MLRSVLKSREAGIFMHVLVGTSPTFSLCSPLLPALLDSRASATIQRVARTWITLRGIASIKGLSAVSIDLGVVKSVGYVTERYGTVERLKTTGYTVFSEEDVSGSHGIRYPFAFREPTDVGAQHWARASLERFSDATRLTVRQPQIPTVSSQCGDCKQSRIRDRKVGPPRSQIEEPAGSSGYS